MRSVRPAVFIVAVVGIVAAALGGVFARVRIKRSTPASNTFLADKNPRFVVEYTGWALDVRARVDGREIESSHRDHTVSFQLRGLTEGEHEVQLTLRQGFALGEAHWAEKITIDTLPPAIHLDQPAEGMVTNQDKMDVSGRTKPYATVKMSTGGPSVSLKTEGDGRFHVTVPISEGKRTLEIVSVDRAGNRKTLRRSLLCDLTAPAVREIFPAEGARVKVDRPTIKIVLREMGSGIKRVTASIDTHAPVELWPGSPAVGENLAVGYKTGEIAEGLRKLHVIVEDVAGNKTDRSVQFLVDSTEVFGSKVMTFGAVGADVATMQKRLVKLGYLEADQVTSRFDDATLQGVKQFQKERHLLDDGIMGGQSISQLLPHIVVNLSKFSLVLLDGDEVEKRYSIACGQPKYPTPTGEFRVAELIANPTWIPPNSVWAREAKEIPPGPGNPLGTRWIGFNSDQVGIHGTNADWSIGTRASHGCMRMHIHDVEELYPLVCLGMEVTIYKGSEKQPIIKQLWPH